MLFDASCFILSREIILELRMKKINKRDRCGSTSLNFFINLEATAWQTCWNNLLKSFEIMWKFLPFALPYLFRKGSFSSTDYIAPINYFLGEIQ